MAHDAVFFAGNLVSRVFEHGRVLDEVADSVVLVVGPEFAVSHYLADFVAVIVLETLCISVNHRRVLTSLTPSTPPVGLRVTTS